MSDSSENERVLCRSTGGGEHRLPPAAAVVVAAVTYGLLPESLLLAPRLAIPGAEAVLLIALVATNPVRMTRETRWSRGISMALAVLVIATNLVALGMLIHALVAANTPGGPLLVAAMQVWLTDVIGFALLFWELDRGGPVSRRRVARDRLPAADWRFSQDENDGAVVEVAITASKRSGWTATFVDYLYLSLTNSSAFSPTDTMPLTSRAKLLMGISRRLLPWSPHCWSLPMRSVHSAEADRRPQSGAMPARFRTPTSGYGTGKGADPSDPLPTEGTT